jgi:hypothetical protein
VRAYSPAAAAAAAVAVARRDIALAVSFTIIMSTKYVVLRLIGTVIIVGYERQRKKYIYILVQKNSFL